MKRAWPVLVVVFVFVSLFESASAQLINYGRRSRFIRTTDVNQSEESLPSWAKELPEPKSAEERRYDINRDGKLQSAEVKIYLRGVLERVESRGYVSVTTDVLREYDKNKDGVINMTEIDLIKEHVK